MTPDVAAVAGAWGALAAMPVVAWSRRRAIAARVAPAHAPTLRRPRLRGPVSRVVHGLAARRAAARADALQEAALPAACDLLVTAVGAGCAPVGAVELLALWGPAPVAEPFRRMLVATGLGASFPDALAELARSAPLLAPVVDVLVASAELGAPATAALIRLADDARRRARRRAETRARVLPVKLLFPLVFLVLPAFGLLTVAPALLSALSRL